MASPLEGMTQAAWARLSPQRRTELRDNSALSPQLVGLDGWRVEVISEMTGEKRRFIVGKSTGWRPCHIELKTRKSISGESACRKYLSVKPLYNARPDCRYPHDP